MSSQVVAGPFSSGLNTQVDPNSIADDELVVCDNFEVDVDGSLRTRPPFVDRGTSLTLAATGNPRFLGYYYVSATTKYLIVADGNTSTWYFNGTSWTLITDTVSAVAICQFNGTLYLLSNSGGPVASGTWTPAGGFVADNNMPKGTSIVAYKSRLFIASDGGGSTPSRIYYSAVLGNTLWSAGNAFFDVNAGDGQGNVALYVLSGSILIFRSSSIWSFSYASDPTFGAQQVIIPDVGLSTADALEVANGALYFIYNGRAYQYSGGSVQQLNPKVPFVAGLRTNCYRPFVVSVFNNRVIFTYYDTLYVFSLRSRTWTTWHSPSYTGIGKIIQWSDATAGDMPVAFAHSNFSVPAGGTRAAKILYLTDGATTEAEVNGYSCVMQTKIFDFGSPTAFKRLFGWGANLVFRGPIQATIMPVQYSSPITWGQLRTSGRTWGTSRLYTWGQPALSDLSAVTALSGQASAFGPQLRYVKFLQNMRFRRAYFKMLFTVDGSTATAPGRIFDLIAHLTVKERVSRQVS